MAVQLVTEKQRGVPHRAILLDVPWMLSAPHTDRLAIFFIQHQARDVIISMQFVPKTVILIADVFSIVVSSRSVFDFEVIQIQLHVFSLLWTVLGCRPLGTSRIQISFLWLFSPH